MRNATLHRRFPGAAVRLHSFHNDAYSTVRSPNQRSPGRRIKSSPFIVDAQPRRPSSDAPLRTMSQSARGWLPADPHTIGSIRIVRQAFHFVFLVVFFLVVRTVVGLGEIDQHRGTKVYSVSWRQSAETAANACSSKVIAGRFMTSAARRGSFAASCLGDGLAVRKPQQGPSTVQLLPENGQHLSPKESWTGARRGDGREGEYRARSFATDFTVRAAQFAGCLGGG